MRAAALAADGPGSVHPLWPHRQARPVMAARSAGHDRHGGGAMPRLSRRTDIPRCRAPAGTGPCGCP